MESLQSLSGLSTPAAEPHANMLVEALLDLADEVDEWRHRARDDDFILMARSWAKLIECYRKSVEGVDQDEREKRLMLADFHALRVQVLQRPLTPCAENPPSPEHQQLLASAVEEFERLGQFDTGAAQEARLLASPSALRFPLVISLIPIRLLLLSIEQPLQDGSLSIEHGRVCLANALSSAQELIDLRQRRLSSQSAMQPSLRSLRSEFEALKPRIQHVSRSDLSFHIQEIDSACARIAAIEGDPHLTEAQRHDIVVLLNEQLEEMQREIQALRHTSDGPDATT